MKKLLFLLPFLLLAGCWTETQTPVEQPPKIEKQIVDMNMMDDEAMFTNWNIIWWPWYMQETNELKSNNMFKDDISAWDFAKYLVVWFIYLNEWNQEQEIMTTDAPKIYDKEWREYSSDIEASSSFYVKESMEMATLRPWIPTPLSVTYIVPKDATGFYFKAEDENGVEHRIHVWDNSQEIQNME